MTSRAEADPGDPGVRFVVGAPEQLFGLKDLTSHADGSISAGMPIGPWLGLQQPGEAGTLGALGVLADTVFGHANHVVAPSGRTWSVTTELSLELVSELPVAGGDLIAVARATGGDGCGALTRGEIRTAGGTVAVGSERGRFVLDGPPAEAFASGAIDHGLELPPLEGVTSLGELLGGLAPVVGGLSLPVSPRVTNPQGNLHGGISLALADLAASAVVPEDMTTTSIRVSYLRPLPGSAEVIELSAQPVHLGRSLALIDVQGRCGDGKLVFAGRVVRES